MSEQPLPRDLDLSKILERIDRSRAEKAERERQTAPESAPQPKPPDAPKAAQLILFPQWADARKAAPNAIFRGA